MDVGCNKGYTSSHFFALWAPEISFRPSEIPKRRPGHLCGTCADCNEEPKAKVAASEGDITVYCVEPSLRNFANLIQVDVLLGRNNAMFNHAPTAVLHCASFLLLLGP